MMIRKLHKLLAFIFWLLSIQVLGTGIGVYVYVNTEVPSKWKFLFILNYVFMFGITAICEIWY